MRPSAVGVGGSESGVYRSRRGSVIVGDPIELAGFDQSVIGRLVAELVIARPPAQLGRFPSPAVGPAGRR